jgi:hypothetical protein
MSVRAAAHNLLQVVVVVVEGLVRWLLLPAVQQLVILELLPPHLATRSVGNLHTPVSLVLTHDLLFSRYVPTRTVES